MERTERPPQFQSVHYSFPQRFCHDPLWNSSVTWNTPDPDFTHCFQQTVLIWIPCVFLWLMLPWQAYILLSSHFNTRQWTLLSTAKIALSLVLFLLALADISYVVHQRITKGSGYLADVDLMAPSIKGGTFLLTVFFIYSTEKRGANPSSATLFIFWSLLFITSIVSFRTHVNIAVRYGIQDSFRFGTYMVYFPVVCAQFVLSFSAGNSPEKEHEGLLPCPEQFASFPNRLTFWWFTSLARLGWARPLQQTDLWDLNPEDRTRLATNRLEKYWNQEMNAMIKSRPNSSTKESAGSRRKPYYPSLFRAMSKAFWLPLMLSGLLKLMNDVMVFVAPQLLQLIIAFVSDKRVEDWKGYFYAVLLLIASFAQTIILVQYFHQTMRLGMHIRIAILGQKFTLWLRLRALEKPSTAYKLITITTIFVQAAIISAVYRKALRITSAAKRASTGGEIVNLMSVDSQRFMDLMGSLHLLWSSPLQIIVSICFLYNQLGPSVFTGLGVMILMIPVNALFAAKARTLQIAQMKEKDSRIKLTSEILNGMKVLKLYAWETAFYKRILGIREHELEALKKAAYLSAVSSFTWNLSPFLVALVSFATYVLVDEKNVLDLSKAFVSLSLFNILRFPLSMLPTVITSVVQAKVSLDRISKFLRNEELDPTNVRVLESGDKSSDSAVSISNGSFAWGKDEPVVLKDINVDVKQGQLVAVVGPVGTGKSSLVAAMLGLMERRSGLVTQKGSISYVSQQAWIQNLTLKENILFGKPLDEQRYRSVVEACALGPDLEMLSAGDQTEIGEKGINLSGGQKQRVSLARAVYSEADVCFLDDPLSAVDAHVGKHLFDNVIGPKGMLAGKTRILVTHGIRFVPQTDLIIVLDNGTVSEVGSYQELLHNDGLFAKFLREYLTETTEAEEDPDTVATKKELVNDTGEPRLQRSQSITSGSSVNSRKISRQDSETLSSRATPEKETESGIPMAALKNGVPMVNGRGREERKGGLVGAEVQEIGSVKWDVYVMFLKHMSYWTSMLVLLFYTVFNGISVYSNIWLSEWSADSHIPERRNSTWWRDYRLAVYGGLGGIQGVFVLFSAIILAFGQIRATRKLHENMLMRILRAPMLFFDTTPLGRIVNRFSKDVDTVDTTLPMNIRIWLNNASTVIATLAVIIYSVPLFAVVMLPLAAIYYFVQRFYIPTSRQLKRLESVSRSPIYSHFQESVAGTTIIVATKQTERFIHDNEHRVDVNNATYYPNIISQRWLAVRLETVGNLITFFAALFAVIGRDRNWTEPKDTALSISYALTITQTLNWTVRMTSELETNVVSVERIKEYTEIESEAEWVILNNRPEKEWPQNGRIQFNDYQTRYRPELDVVLKGVTADISPSEKIGIVGRTGAGKSSLTLALFRVIEPAGGTIIIDGVDISTLGLHDVRSHITILPQEPVLFSGTLRLNLDPFDVYSDDDVWSALENSHLKRFVSSLPDGLQHPVAEGGENLSVGQRQLICLARALLRKTRILVLDEATAAIDLETDDLIQRTIREKFADCTILTIAHRLNTVMDSTRIMVLDQGRVKEFDAPLTLLQNRSTIFYGLARDANLV